MEKFTILEKLKPKIYTVTAEITLVVIAENEGDAGYQADSILGGIEEQENFSIKLIERKK